MQNVCMTFEVSVVNADGTLSPVVINVDANVTKNSNPLTFNLSITQQNKPKMVYRFSATDFGTMIDIIAALNADAS